MKIRYSLPESGSRLSCRPTKTGPSSWLLASGSGGDSIFTVPICERAGQLTGLRLPLPNCPSVQVCRPLGPEALLAAAGLIPIPVGRVTVAFLVLELSWPVALFRCGTAIATEAPAGELTLPVPGLVATVGT